MSDIAAPSAFASINYICNFVCYSVVVGPCLRPERSAGDIADGIQLRRHVRRHDVRLSVGQVRPKEIVGVGAGDPGGRRQRHGSFTQLLRLHCTSLHRRSLGTGARAVIDGLRISETCPVT